MKARSTLNAGDQMRRTPLISAIAIVTACATDTSLTAPLQRTDVPPASVSSTFIGTGFVFPDAINDADVVAGYFRAGSTDHAFRWTPGGTLQDLHGSSPWAISRANDVSNAGHVVGIAFETMSGRPRAWMWTPSSPTLRALSPAQGAAFGVNNNGLAVGYVIGADGNTRYATAWPATGGEIRSSIAHNVALDVNDAGQVLVSVSFGFAIWNPLADPAGTSMRVVKATDFPGAGWFHFTGTEIDELGRVTGNGGRGSFSSSAFLWTPGPGAGNVQQLATTGFSGWATTINGSNQVAGFRTDNSSGHTVPVYWPSLGAEAVALPDPIGTTHGRATGINASGKIVGWVSNSSGGRGVLWDLNGIAANLPPVANAGPDQVLECVMAMASATLDGRGSFDPDGEIVDYSWRWLALNLVVGTGATSTLPLGQGVHEFALAVKDDDGASAEDRVRVEVRDSHAPDITLTQHATELWPPDRRMVKIASGIKASDACAGGAAVNVTVTANQEMGDDYQIMNTPQGAEVLVRAVRDARDADGRIYTISLSANDGTNQATRVLTARVPRMPR